MKLVNKLLRILPVVAALALSAPVSAGDKDLGPDIPQSKGEQCVMPTDDMRRNHMDYLLTHRDETMHQGIRTEKYSLKECMECHSPEVTQSEASQGEGQFFCASCHSYAGVNVDCFQCHTTKPESTAKFHPLVSPGMKAWKNAHRPASTELLNQMAKNNAKAEAAQ